MMTAMSYQKAVRDGRTLLNHARAVIVLNNQGGVANIVYRDSGSLLNVIGILGPVYHNGKTIALAVRSEIGIGRAVPYQKSEKELFGERVSTPKRNFYQLHPEAFKKILPDVLTVIQCIVDRDTMHRKRLTYVKSNRFNDSEEYKSGKFISVPEDLALLRFLCLAKDMEIRVSGHLRQFIEYTKDKLIVARFAHYSIQQIKRKWWAQEIANNIYEAGYGEYFFEVIRNSLGQEGSKIRNLFEQVVEAYAIEPKQGKDREYLVLRERFGDVEEETLKNFPLNVMMHEKRVVLREKKYPRSSPLYHHARGSLRVEVRPSDGAVERHSKIQTMYMKDREHVESLP